MDVTCLLIFIHLFSPFVFSMISPHPTNKCDQGARLMLQLMMVKVHSIDYSHKHHFVFPLPVSIQAFPVFVFSLQMLATRTIRVVRIRAAHQRAATRTSLLLGVISAMNSLQVLHDYMNKLNIANFVPVITTTN